ncbi:TonB-dependent receptor [Rheinheimera pacifica]|uniref:TonB-dependent receptor n=1 Tax=Rheinheimera pacifica TaxID=173990 RepID=UPI002166C838|nr:TonB-dependent receptor [Rheinheimera pacifica]MCS4306336.1 TonB-dependent receptor [Rheinheimera pacifica]
MNHTRFKLSRLAISLSLITGAGVMAPVYANDDTAQTTEVEVIQVTGIRGSLAKSMDIKRESTGVVDAITAEDIGKFPDTNLAESLQRITGVSIDRSNNEGSRITVRGFGPEFNLVTLNGRQMPTNDGRSFDFANLATESVSGVQVHKTARADVPSGGIGATVNISTARPLDNPGLKAAVGAKAVYDTANESGDDFTPELSAIFSNTFADDKFGILISGSVQERKNRAEGMAVDNWIPNVDLSNSPNLQLTDNNQRADGNTWYPQNAGYEILDNDRKRTNGQLVMQFAPTDNFKATLDYTYAKQELDVERYGFGVWFNNGGNVQSATINENGTYVNMTEVNGDYATNLNRNGSASETKSLGLNLAWQVTNNLSLELDAHSSKAISKGTGLGHDAYMIIGNTSWAGDDAHPNATANLETKTANFTPGGIPVIDFTLTNGQPEILPSDMGSLFGGVSKNHNENAMDQVQLKGEWLNSSDSALVALDFGISYTNMDFNYNNAYSGQLAAGWWLWSADWYPDDMFYRVDTSSLLDKFSGGGSDKQINYFYAADFYDIVNIAESIDCDHPDGGIGACSWPASLNGRFGSNAILENHKVNEKNISLYTQARFETEFNGMPVNIVTGLRYEQTDLTANSLETPAISMQWVNGNEWAYSYTNEQSYSDGRGKTREFLPNVDVNVEIIDDLMGRFSYSRSLTRPPVDDLRSVTSFDGNPKVGQRKVSVGNPSLKPYTSDNIDLSLEYYYAPGSYVSAGYYRKQVDNFLVGVTTEETMDNLRDIFNGPRAEQAIAELVAEGIQPTDPAIFARIHQNQGTDPSGPIFSDENDPLTIFSVLRQNNVETGNLWGWELAAQHMFADTGFGVQANATFVYGDVEADRNAIGYQFALPGLSDSANLSLIYENYGLSVRVSYNWRDEFLSGFDQHQAPVFTESYGQWDINVNYAVTDNLTVFVEGLNITEETQRTYVRFPEQFLRGYQYGARYNLGVRYTF